MCFLGLTKVLPKVTSWPEFGITAKAVGRYSSLYIRSQIKSASGAEADLIYISSCVRLQAYRRKRRFSTPPMASSPEPMRAMLVGSGAVTANISPLESVPEVLPAVPATT